MSDTETTLETLNRIDNRQDLILDDLDRLNNQIINIIEAYTNTRPEDAEGKSSSRPTLEAGDGSKDAAAA